jgi:phage regulator Rha-like protein
MKTNIVEIKGQQVFTTSLVIAKACDNRSHESTIKLIRKYQSDFEELGTFGFEIQKSGGIETTYAILNEDQATYLITLFRNTPIVRRFKLELVKAFRKALDEVARLYANPPRRDILEGKRKAHHGMMDALVELREEAGKNTEAHHFMTENKLCNWAVTGSFNGINETALSNEDAILLGKVRRCNESYIMAGLDYAERKKRIQVYVMRYKTKLISKVKTDSRD